MKFDKKLEAFMFSLPEVLKMNSLPKVTIGNYTKKDIERQGQQKCWHIYTDDGVACKSYGVIIAFKDSIGRVFIDGDYWNYSSTTARHRREFLNEGRAETERKIANGTYILCNLN